MMKLPDFLNPRISLLFIFLLFYFTFASADFSSWQESFRLAEKTFNSMQQSDSIELFQKLIDEISAEKATRDLTEEELELLQRSYDYQGRAYFDDNQPNQTREAFSAILQLNPNFTMDENLISPKIIDLFTRLKKEKLGTISIRTKPEEVKVKLNGKSVANAASLYVLPGDQVLEISKPGYETVTETVNVSAGSRKDLTIQLKSISDSIVELISSNQDLLELYQSAVASSNKKELGDALGKVGEFVIKQNRLTEAASVFGQMLKISGELNDPDLRGRASLNLGDISQTQNDLSNAQTRYTEAVAAFKEAGNESASANAAVKLGDVAAQKNDPEGAKKSYEQALSFYRTAAQKKKEEADVLYKIGNILRAQKDPAARAHYEQALALFQQVNDSASASSVQRVIEGLQVAERNKSIDLLNEASALRGQGRFSEAEQKFAQALEMARQAGARNNMATALLNLGFLMTSDGKYVQAKPKYEEALAISRETGNKNLEALALYNLAVTYYNLGDRTEADTLYNQSALIYQSLQQNPQPRPW